MAHDRDKPAEAPSSAPRSRRVRLIRKVRPARSRRVRLVKEGSARRSSNEAKELDLPPVPPDDEPSDEGDDGFLFDEIFDEFELGDERERAKSAARAVADAVIPEILKRLVAAGGDAINEDRIRSVLSESIPKEVGSTLLGHAGVAKGELYKIVAGEVRRFLGTINVAGELQKILTSLSFEVRTEVRFIPNDQAVVKPRVKNRVKVKWANRP